MILAKIDYIDMHIHMEDMDSADVHDDILYLANALDEVSYHKTTELANKCPSIIPTFGIHPMRAADVSISEKTLEKLIKSSPLVGEIGLDFHWIEDRETYPLQREIFEKQLALCKRYNKIPSIHTKGAEVEVLRCIRKMGISRSIIHWYSGPEELIPEFLKSGCYFTIGPDIFTDSTVYRHIPINRMFLETDNPTGMPWIVGGIPSGDDIKKLYKSLANTLKMDEKLLIDVIKANFRELTQLLFY